MHAPVSAQSALNQMVVRTRKLNLILGSDAAPVHILHDIDVEIAAGETVAILGASGSGKTSLMAVLSSLEQASSGEVHVAGADFGAMDEDALALVRRKGIGIVLQSFHLLPTMTALENVAVPMELAGVADAFARAEQELNKVGLAHRTGHYPAQLSGGEQQRVAIARAPQSSSPMSRRGTLMVRPAMRSSTSCSRGRRMPAPHWSSSRTTPHWRRNAGASFGCRMAAS